jgi:hypothetical protein
LEQISEAAQAEKEDEHSDEWLTIFSQEAEKKEAAALKLTTEEEKEQANKVLTPWEMELEMLEDWLNNPEPTGELIEDQLSEKVTKRHVNPPLCFSFSKFSLMEHFRIRS